MLRMIWIIIGIIGADLVVGLLTFFIFNAIFGLWILALIVAITTAIFVSLIGVFVIIRNFLQVEYQRQVNVAGQKGHLRDEPPEDQMPTVDKVIDSTIKYPDKEKLAKKSKESKFKFTLGRREPTTNKAKKGKEPEKRGAPPRQAQPPLILRGGEPADTEEKLKRGKVSSVGIMLTGRPTKIVEQGAFIVTSMQASAMDLPKNMPLSELPSMIYTVYIDAKERKKVAMVLEDPEDMLMLEGLPYVDSESGRVFVFVLAATTEKLQEAELQEEYYRTLGR